MTAWIMLATGWLALAFPLIPAKQLYDVASPKVVGASEVLLPVVLTALFGLVGWYSVRGQYNASAHATCALVPAAAFGFLIAFVASPILEQVSLGAGVIPDFAFSRWRELPSLMFGLFLGFTLVAPAHLLWSSRPLRSRALALTGAVAGPCAAGLVLSLQHQAIHWAMLAPALMLMIVSVALTEGIRIVMERVAGVQPPLVTRDDMHPSGAYRDGNPARKVGVAVSGGGYRASLFGLGALMYVHEVCKAADVPRRVLALTSVSGGSITNGVIAHGVRIGKDDRERFDRVARRLIHHATGAGSMFTAGHAVPYYTLLLASALTAIPILWFGVSRVTWAIIWHAAMIPLGLAAVLFGFAFVLSQVERVKNTWIVGVLVVFPIGGFVLSTIWLLDRFLSQPTWRQAMAWLAASLLMIVAAAILWSLRGMLIQEIFDILLRDGGASPRLADVHTDTHHVFCSTEVQFGETVYFAHDAIRVRGFQAVRPDAMPTAAAVRASAALPGAFPPMVIAGIEGNRSQGVGGRGARSDVKTSHLVLVDGGVRDNLGTSWFDIVADVDELVVVSAAANRHGSRAILRLPGVSEVLALLNLVNIPYNTRERGHRRAIAKQLFARPWTSTATAPGAIVHIEDSPFDLAQKIAARAKSGKPLGLWLDSSGLPDWDVDQALIAEHLWAAAGERSHVLVDRAAAVVHHFAALEPGLPHPPALSEDELIRLTKGQQLSDAEAGWWMRTRMSALVGTTLHRVEPREAGNLVLHGYYLAMATLHICVGWPLSTALDQERVDALFGAAQSDNGDADECARELQRFLDEPLEAEYLLVTLWRVHQLVRQGGEFVRTHVVVVVGFSRSGLTTVLGVWLAPAHDVPLEVRRDIQRMPGELRGRYAAFWSNLFEDLRRRGVKRILACCRDVAPRDELSPHLMIPLDAALQSAFPEAVPLPKAGQVVDHLRLILTSGPAYFGKVLPELRAILTMDAAVARKELDQFVARWSGEYPIIGELSAHVWEQTTIWFRLSREVREVLVRIDADGDDTMRAVSRGAAARGPVAGHNRALVLVLRDVLSRNRQRERLPRWAAFAERLRHDLPQQPAGRASADHAD